MKCEIDCVILWVDGGDLKWKNKKKKYSKIIDDRSIDMDEDRYRDWGLLKYLLRGLERFAPWFRKIFLVTDEQIPEWIDINNDKLNIIDHTEFIPASYLPTFNSHTIELNIHRINGLAENFVYFNDDMFLLKELKPEFFFKKDMPCDSAVMNAFAIKKSKDFRFLMPINDIELINTHFDKSLTLKKVWWKYFNYKYGKDVLRTICLLPWKHFTGFTINHMPYSIKKSTMEKVWSLEYSTLNETCLHKFRNSNDVNIWLMQYWQYAEGMFYPRTLKNGILLALSDSIEEDQKVCDIVRKQKYSMCCINDCLSDSSNYDVIKKMIIEAFEYILPNKSSFEV